MKIMPLQSSVPEGALRHPSQNPPRKSRSTRLNQLLASPPRTSYLDRKAFIFATPLYSSVSSHHVQKQTQTIRDAQGISSACETLQDSAAIEPVDEKHVHPSASRKPFSRADKQVRFAPELATDCNKHEMGQQPKGREPTRFVGGKWESACLETHPARDEGQ